MAHTGAFTCVFVAALLSCDLAARIKNSPERFIAPEAETSQDVCPEGIPELRTFKLSPEVKRECGRPAWGTVYVGILGAHDMVSMDWFSKNDPYARFRISDKHMREMRGWNSKEKPVAVTDDLVTETKRGEAEPMWKKTFAFDFLCPQFPFAPSEAPAGKKTVHYAALGAKPPIVVHHPQNHLLNQNKSGHEFQLELTLKDYDFLNADDSLGRVQIPILDIMNEKHHGLTPFWLFDETDSEPRGHVDLLLWYCEHGDAECEEERSKEWALHHVSDKVVKRTKFDCEMGCHTLLDPKRGRLAQYVRMAQVQLQSAVGSPMVAQKWEKEVLPACAAHPECAHLGGDCCPASDGMMLACCNKEAGAADVQSDPAAIAAMEAEHRNETRDLQQKSLALEELEEVFDKGVEQNREESWAKAVSLAKQLASLDGLGSQLCSESPIFGQALQWASKPLFNYVYDPKNNFLAGPYEEEHAKGLAKGFHNLEMRLTKLEGCLRHRWYEDSQLLVNQWETTPKCHTHFNEAFGTPPPTPPTTPPPTRYEYVPFGSGACRGRSPTDNPPTWFSRVPAYNGGLAECQARCSASPECKAIEFQGGGNTHCELWTEVPQATSGRGQYTCMLKQVPE